MADARTPKTATVRTAWIKGHPFPLTTDLAEREAEFWRWLAAHDREVAGKAWEACYDRVIRAGERDAVLNPYREEN